MQSRDPVTVHRLLKACYAAFAACGLFSFFVNLLMLTMPLFMYQVFDRVLASRSTSTLFLLLLMATIALGVQAALDAVRAFAFVRMSRWIDRRIAPLLSISGTLHSSAAGASASRGGPTTDEAAVARFSRFVSLTP